MGEKTGRLPKEISQMTRILEHLGLLRRTPCVMCGLPHFTGWNHIVQWHHRSQDATDVECICAYHHPYRHRGRKLPRYLVNGGHKNQASKFKFYELAIKE